MKNLEVNKAGTFCGNFEKKYLFRKGEIREWVNYFSPAMIEKLSKTMEEKLEGSGLSFKNVFLKCVLFVTYDCYFCFVF